MAIIKMTITNRISICFGTFNRLELLRRVLDNISEQIKAEVVIADGGSTDGTIKFLESRNEVKLIKEGKRSSYPEFMNKAVRESTGNLIVQWNDDALMCPGGWKALVNVGQDVSGYRFPYREGDTVSFDGGFARPRWMSFGCYFRSVLRKYGLYHCGFSFYDADVELSNRILALSGKDSLPYLDKCNVYHLKSNVSRTHSKKSKETEQDVRLCRQICHQTNLTKTIPSGVEFL